MVRINLSCFVIQVLLKKMYEAIQVLKHFNNFNQDLSFKRWEALFTSTSALSTPCASAFHFAFFSPLSYSNPSNNEF